LHKLALLRRLADVVAAESVAWRLAEWAPLRSPRRRRRRRRGMRTSSGIYV